MFAKFKEVLDFKRAALLLFGAKDIFNSKLASSLLRYRAKDILAVIGEQNEEYYNNLYAPLGVVVPSVYKSIKEIKEDVDVLIICTVLPSGKLPIEWLDEIKMALNLNIKVINPLHVDFEQEFNLCGIQSAPKSTPLISYFRDSQNYGLYREGIYNIRIPHKINKLFSLEVLNTKAKRVLTVGTDCNVGKMLTSLELNKTLIQKGFKSSFVATGQIGMLISGNGIAIDRVISDFLPAYVEELILEQKNKDILIVEGQGSIFQPLYSAVTMGLIHGTAPDYMILTHVPGRLKLRYTDIDIPRLEEAIFMYERVARMVNSKAKITGIALNTHHLSNKEAENLIVNLQKELMLPVTDPVKFNDMEKLIPIEDL